MTKKPTKSTAVTWGQRPSAKTQALAPGTADSFVQGPKSDTIRLNFNISRALHMRIKLHCALQQRPMTEAILELLEANFPAGQRRLNALTGPSDEQSS